MVMFGGYEPDECSEVLASIDGVLVSPGGGGYLVRFCGAGDGNPDQDTGWRQAVIEVSLTAGVHTLQVGGYDSKKTYFDEATRIYFDDIVVEFLDETPGTEAVCNDGVDNDGDGLADCLDSDCAGSDACSGSTTLVSASFASTSEGFGYSDDAFRGTSQPQYASGSYEAAEGYSGGGLKVVLGGVDTTLRNGMSGGWSKTFTVSKAGNVSISLRYRLIHAGDFEPDECSKVLVTLDGVLISAGSYDYIMQYCGVGDGSQSQDSGWRLVELSVPLDVGTHTMAIGGYLSKKTFNNEFANLFLDDVHIVQDNVGSLYVDDFQDGVPNGWTVVDDSGKNSDWRVSQGKYTQFAELVDGWDLSAHLGSYAFVNDAAGAFDRSDYLVAARVRSLTEISELRDDVGLMIRYIDRSNYLRLSISKMQGFIRLEKKVNGVFTTIAFSGRPPALGSTINVKAYVLGEQLLVYVNDDPLFSVSDPDLGIGHPLSSGTVALYAQGKAEFDNVMIGMLDDVPRVVISTPRAYSVVGTDKAPQPSQINASAVALNVPSGGGVRFILDSGAFCDDYSTPYTTIGCPAESGFADVFPGEHRLEAIIIDSAGQPVMDSMGLDRDVNERIAVGGKYLVMIGDSITNGVGDNSDNLAIGTQNDAANGKNLNRGIAPILNDLLGDYVSELVVVQNEGLGGTTSQHGWGRLDSTIARHIKPQIVESIWLILFGTNDSASTINLPDGSDCSESDFLNNEPSCNGTYKYYLRELIMDLKAAGGVPLIGKVPYAKNVPQNQITLIQKYNIVVDQLTIDNNLQANPPDFFNYFLNNQNSAFFDNVHPNGIGYGAMADMWICNMIPGVFSGSKPSFCSGY
jgi:lysophospholipase L1-like esterase